MPAVTIMVIPMRRSIRCKPSLSRDGKNDLLTVLAALDEDMAEWLFDLVAEASCSVHARRAQPTKNSPMLLWRRWNFRFKPTFPIPLKLKIDPVATAEVLHRHLRLSCGNGGPRGVTAVDRCHARGR